jgi:hypothetical protein
VKPGFSIRVVPGYQRMNLRQREAMLGLAEGGDLSSPVRVLRNEDVAVVQDRSGRTYRITPAGVVERRK